MTYESTIVADHIPSFGAYELHSSGLDVIDPSWEPVQVVDEDARMREALGFLGMGEDDVDGYDKPIEKSIAEDEDDDEYDEVEDDADDASDEPVDEKPEIKLEGLIDITDDNEKDVVGELDDDVLIDMGNGKAMRGSEFNKYLAEFPQLQETADKVIEARQELTTGYESLTRYAEAAVADYDAQLNEFKDLDWLQLAQNPVEYTKYKQVYETLTMRKAQAESTVKELHNEAQSRVYDQQIKALKGMTSRGVFGDVGYEQAVPDYVQQMKERGVDVSQLDKIADPFILEAIFEKVTREKATLEQSEAKRRTIRQSLKSKPSRKTAAPTVNKGRKSVKGAVKDKGDMLTGIASNKHDSYQAFMQAMGFDQ